VLPHELLHTLGAIDLYGPWNGCLPLNSGVSLMSTGSGAAPHAENSIAVDAVHKMWLGWTEPRVVAIGTAGSAGLAADHVPVAAEPERKRPLLFYDPQHGKSEFFLLEYRTPYRLGDDSGVASSGLVIWHVAYGPDGRPLVRKSEQPTCDSKYPDIRVIFTRGAPDFRQGGNRAYTSAHGEIVFKWLDGRDSGLRVRVAPHTAEDPVLNVSWTAPGAVTKEAGQ
jgi:hypothetical protein